jgi:flagellar protein FliL
VADSHEKTESGAAAGGGSGKLMMGLLGLNMVVMIAVAVVLFLGQKKQAQQASLDQVAEGAHAEAGEHGAPAAGGEHGAPAAGGEHGGGGGGHGGGGKGEPVVDPNAAKFFALGDFTANLSGPASAHYVKLTVNFEISKDADEEEMKARKPQFRDKVISLLNAKKPDDLQSAEGRNYLKEEIKTVANTFVKKGKVEGVYFSAFVIN